MSMKKLYKEIQSVTYGNGNKILVAASLKAGSTSIIHNLGYPLIGRFKHRKDRDGVFKLGFWKEYDIHELNKAIIEQHSVRVAVVRDPLDRLISCYKDRVLLRNKEGISDKIDSFSDFLENLDELRSSKDHIYTHTQTQCFHIGKNPDLYTHVVNSKQINEILVPIIETVSGHKNIPRLQEKNTNKIDHVDVTPKDIERTRKIYKEDYDVWGRYF